MSDCGRRGLKYMFSQYGYIFKNASTEECCTSKQIMTGHSFAMQPTRKSI
jgi:hypothetical protein